MAEAAGSLSPGAVDAVLGKAVAWSADGTRIVASGDSWEELYQDLRRRGIDPLNVVDEYIYDPNQAYP